jgi:hypothetical protein
MEGDRELMVGEIERARDGGRRERERERKELNRDK